MWIEEAAQAKLAAAREHIEKKWKAKEEEAWKAEEVQKTEETRKVEEMWKEEEDKVVREKALKRQLEVCLSTSHIYLFLLKTDWFQMLWKRKEVKKAQWVDIDGVSTGKFVSNIRN